MDEWSWANLAHHRAISAEIARTRQTQIQEFRVWPIPSSDLDLDNWLTQHQQWHDAINGVLGVPGVDLQNVDLSEKEQRDNWFYIHFLQHRAWAQALGNGL